MGVLDGEVALVTGGASGIGRAVAERYVEEGAKVAVVDFVPDRLAEMKKQLGDRIITVQADLSTLDGNRRAVAETVKAFGKLDVFVANAGLGDAFTELVDITEDKLEAAFNEVYDINVKGVIFGARVAIAELLKTNGSFIITLSNSSFYPDGGGVIYISSKHAALGIMRQLAHEFAPHVKVNAVSPGATYTDKRMPAAFGVDDKGERVRTQTHPSNIDEAVERVTPLKMHARPPIHAGAYVLLASRRDNQAMTGTVIQSEAGLGIRGLRRVRGGDNLKERVLGSVKS
jgi:NAD(P)-dependent dehydrogenase (short-subunit alcohol dehydrogenase family)